MDRFQVVNILMFIIFNNLLYVNILFPCGFSSQMASSKSTLHLPGPIVVNTWPFSNATIAAWQKLKNGLSALDAVEAGCLQAEHDPSLESVTFGNHPDEEGNVTFDALIMDGNTRQAGAVASMPGIRPAISVARAVLERTRHTLLVGEAAARFGEEMGFPREGLNTNQSQQQWLDWRRSNCQPNFRRNVSPDPIHYCGPYTPTVNINLKQTTGNPATFDSHDTIGLVAIDKNGAMAVGTTTNGAAHRVPGRVGDTPIVGAGAYVDSSVGGVVGTGDGDTLMRFLLSYRAVESMRQGADPQSAVEEALQTIPDDPQIWAGGLVALDRYGRYGAACRGSSFANNFAFTVATSDVPKVVFVKCMTV